MGAAILLLLTHPTAPHPAEPRCVRHKHQFVRARIHNVIKGVQKEAKKNEKKRKKHYHSKRALQKLISQLLSINRLLLIYLLSSIYRELLLTMKLFTNLINVQK